MTTFLIFLHVAAAIILIGPTMVATSAFPKMASKAAAGDEPAAGAAAFLHHISTQYGMMSMVAPLLGGAVLAFDFEAYRSNYFLHTAIVLSVLAWGFLFGMVIPQQRKIVGTLGALDPAEADVRDVTTNIESARVKAAAGAGIFNLLWVLVLILMFLPSPA